MTKYTKILLCIISIVCLFSFVSCSSTKTLEDYANKDKEFKSDVNNMFSNAGVEGKVDISKNTIYMTIDISSLIGDMKVTDDLKNSLKDSFNKNFESQDSEIYSAIEQIEKETKISDIEMILNVTLNDETIWSKKYTLKYKNKETVKNENPSSEPSKTEKESTKKSE